MTFIDFFSGIGGFRRGMELAGHKCVGFCEYDKFAVASYTSMHLISEEQRQYLETLDKNKRQKEILKEEYRNGEWYADDIRTVSAREIPGAECWCFGFPCQDISIAGKQVGFYGNRSSLFFRVMYLLGQVPEEKKPHTLFIENVKNLLSVNGGWDFARLLVEMDRGGYDAEWQIVNSKDYGVPQNRERVFIIGHLRGHSRSEVFPICSTNGKANIPKINLIAHRDGYRRNSQVFDPNGITESIDTAEGGGREPHVAQFLIDMNVAGKPSDYARALTANYDGGVCKRPAERSGVAIPIRNGLQDHQKWSDDGVAPTLTAAMGMGGGYVPVIQETVKSDVCIPVLTPERLNKRQNGRRFKEDGDVAFTLTSEDRHGVMVQVRTNNSKGYEEAEIGEDGVNIEYLDSTTRRGRVQKGGTATLDTGATQGIFVQLADNVTAYAVWYEKTQCYVAIRKLTPKECFRLQGWTDDYFEKAELVNSNAQLYKQAGNGVTVNVIKIIGEKLWQLENTDTI